MKALRTAIGWTAVASLAAAFPSVSPLAAQSSAPAAPAHGIVGAWTLNPDLSDKPQGRNQDDGQDDRGSRPQGGGGGMRGYGGGRRGGYGRGGMGGGGARGNMSPEDRQRLRDAMRDIMNPPDRLTVTEGNSMVIVTSGDGRTTRLSPNGKSIKDESTKIARKTKWDGDKLVSEISGAAPRKITETYQFDSEHKQLHVTVQLDNPNRPLVVSRVYDANTATP